LSFVEAKVARTLRALLGNPAIGRVWIVEVAARPVGYAVLTFGFSLEYGGRDAKHDELYLEPAHRGAGLGVRVMALLEEACIRLGIRALHLEVDRGNGAGLALYARRGFSTGNRAFLTKWLVADPAAAD
jgi:GNAT superfamily N-acetyltransferase